MALKHNNKISGILAVFLIFLLTGYPMLAQQMPVIEFSEQKVWVKRIDPEVLYTFCRYNNTQSDWRTVFPVYTEASRGETTIDGTYKVLDSAVIFIPRFPFVKSVRYIAEFHLEQLAKNYNEVYLPASPSEKLFLEFSLQADRSETPKVLAVYPSADVLPENLLKFHITFNSPMTTGEAYKRIRLLDDQQREIEKAFLIVDQEFWDDEMKVLTIMLDPGRIKRGLKANIQLGAPLQAGKRYSLVVDEGWKNIDGRLTHEKYIKQFQCVNADRSRPDPKDWRLTFSKNVLTINLNETFNWIMLPTAFQVKDSRNNIIAGKITVNKKESTIIFEPDYEWNNETYTVHINPLLEDLAGNNLTRLFDEDLTTQSSDPARQNFILTFQPKFAGIKK